MNLNGCFKMESAQYKKKKKPVCLVNGNLVTTIDASLLNEIQVNLPFREFSLLSN